MQMRNSKYFIGSAIVTILAALGVLTPIFVAVMLKVQPSISDDDMALGLIAMPALMLALVGLLSGLLYTSLRRDPLPEGVGMYRLGVSLIGLGFVVGYFIVQR
jgi:hypothetical protein